MAQQINLRSIAHRAYTWLVNRGYTEAYALSATREILHAEDRAHAVKLVTYLVRSHQEED